MYTNSPKMQEASLVANTKTSLGFAPALGMTRSLSLAEQAADVIVTGIYAGALEPGARLYEKDLAHRLNMSRVPLREALKILEAQGIVESIPHRGSRIALFGDERASQIIEARIALERIAVTAAAPRYKSDPTLAADLDRLIARMETAAAYLDWVAISKADLAFHREICRVSGNEIVGKLWESLARHVFIVFGHEKRRPEDAADLGDQHRRLRDLLLAGDAASLQREIEAHVLRIRRRV